MLLLARGCRVRAAARLRVACMVSLLPAARVVRRFRVAVVLVSMPMSMLMTVLVAVSARGLRRRGRMLLRLAAKRSWCRCSGRRLGGRLHIGVMRRNGWSRRRGPASEGAVNISRLCLMGNEMAYRLPAQVTESLSEPEAGEAA